MTIYRERLLPGPWVFAATALVIPATALVFLPIDMFVGVVAAVVGYAGCAAALIAASPVIEVSDSELVAGRARLSLEFVGAVSAYERADATAERGPRLDARAWLVIRGWIDPVVKVELTDDRDPAPYWLLSTRRPVELMAALTTRRKV